MYMTIEQQKEYITLFASQGIPLDKCYALVYLEEEAIDKIKVDEEFMKEMKDLQVQLSLDKITDYNSKVDCSLAPSDHLKRLQTIAPDIFTETPAVAVSGNLIINKVRDE